MKNNDLCQKEGSSDGIDAFEYAYFAYNNIIAHNAYALHPNSILRLKKVIFNNPATIIIWNDGTKTVVKKAKDDSWDPEKGLAMAIIKKYFGRTSFIKKYTKSSETNDIYISFDDALKNISNLSKKLKGTFKISKK